MLFVCENSDNDEKTLEEIRILIKAGARLDDLGNCNRSCLHTLIIEGFVGGVQLLLEAGANPDLRCPDGLPLHLVLRRANDSLRGENIDLPCKLSLCKCLLLAKNRKIEFSDKELAHFILLAAQSKPTKKNYIPGLLIRAIIKLWPLLSLPSLQKRNEAKALVFASLQAVNSTELPTIVQEQILLADEETKNSLFTFFSDELVRGNLGKLAFFKAAKKEYIDFLFRHLKKVLNMLTEQDPAIGVDLSDETLLGLLYEGINELCNEREAALSNYMHSNKHLKREAEEAGISSTSTTKKSVSEAWKSSVIESENDCDVVSLDNKDYAREISDEPAQEEAEETKHLKKREAHEAGIVSEPVAKKSLAESSSIPTFPENEDESKPNSKKRSAKKMEGASSVIAKRRASESQKHSTNSEE